MITEKTTSVWGYAQKNLGLIVFVIGYILKLGCLDF